MAGAWLVAKNGHAVYVAIINHKKQRPSLPNIIPKLCFSSVVLMSGQQIDSTDNNLLKLNNDKMHHSNEQPPLAHATLLVFLLLSIIDVVVGSAADRGAGPDGDGTHHDSGSSSATGSGCNGMTCGTTIIAIAACIACLVVLCGVALAFSSCKKTRAFSKACEEAKGEILADAEAPTKSDRPVITFEKTKYTATYHDSHWQSGSIMLDSSGTLVFESITSGTENESFNSEPEDNAEVTLVNYKSMSGTGKNKDGYFKILEGSVSMRSGKAYWIKEDQDSLVKSLVTGTFVRQNNKLSFQGSFQSNNGSSGDFVTFDLDANDEEKGSSNVRDAPSPPEQPLDQL